jgi:hypothetical protein
VPTRIGPVRSARITDIDLLAQYGRPAFAYSGAQRRMWPVLANASIHDVSPYRLYSAYSRDGSRRAPYNEFLDGRAALVAAPRASVAQDMGVTFDAAVPAGGLTATRADMKWGYSAAGFRYDPATGLYSVSLNGRPAESEGTTKGQNAATVVIQSVVQKPSAFFDKGGGNTPHAQTIGEGTAIVLRDGLGWEVRWSRPTATSGTTYVLPDGSPLPFKPGQTWIVLLDSKRTPVVRPMTPPPVETPAPTAAPSPIATPSPTATPAATGSATPHA